RATREDQHVFVNRRPVENRGVNFALLEGYHTALMKGRYPVCCLFIEVSPAEVDVNIHPAKREVKFHRERAVRGLLTRALSETLLKFHTPPPAPLKPATVAPRSRLEPAELPDFGGAVTLPPAPAIASIAPPPRSRPEPVELPESGGVVTPLPSSAITPAPVASPASAPPPPSGAARS